MTGMKTPMTGARKALHAALDVTPATGARPGVCGRVPQVEVWLPRFCV